MTGLLREPRGALACIAEVEFSEVSERSGTAKAPRLKLLLVLLCYIATCSVSLVYVSKYYGGYHLFSFHEGRVYPALLNIAPLVLVSLLFTVARLSFGYLLGFYFYTMILGYLWLAKFSLLDYDHTRASTSAVLSLLALLAPALFITSPIKRRVLLSETAFDYLLYAILISATLAICAGAFYNFRIIEIARIYNFRDQIAFPGPLRYAIGNLMGTLLPFAFAGLLARGSRWLAAASLLLLLLFYPVTLTKQSLFAPVWLLYLAVLTLLLEARLAITLSLLLLMGSGLILVPLVEHRIISYAHFISYFGTINFRMLAVPSIALDMYNHFFSTHSLTHFCQISFVKPLVDCPYTDPLSVVMAKHYELGDANASLFATEGIASVGSNLAPLSGLLCGLVIALANRLSVGLPPRFIVVSGGVLAQILLNVPLTTSLLSNGAAALFLLWYLTPREIFDQGQIR